MFALNFYALFGASRFCDNPRYARRVYSLFFNRASFACRVMKYVLRIVSVAIRGRVQENPFVFNWLSERVALTNPIPGVRVAPRSALF